MKWHTIIIDMCQVHQRRLLATPNAASDPLRFFDKDVADIVRSMSLREQIGQMMMVIGDEITEVGAFDENYDHVTFEDMNIHGIR